MIIAQSILESPEIIALNALSSLMWSPIFQMKRIFYSLENSLKLFDENLSYVPGRIQTNILPIQLVNGHVQNK